MSAKLKWKDAKGVRTGVEMTERYCLNMMRHAHKEMLRYRSLERLGRSWAHEEYLRRGLERKQWMFVIRTLREYTRVGATDVVGERILQRIRRNVDLSRAQAA